MKKAGRFIVLAIVGIILFIALYYLTHDKDSKNNFVNTTAEPEEKMSIEQADELGTYLVNEAILFYEKTPGNTNKTKTINDEKYLKLDSFMKEAKNLFSEKEINDFIEYYDILKEEDDYYIKETNNELVYIYENVKAKTRTIDNEKTEYKVDWEYCEAEESSELSECVDTSSLQYKNNLTIEVIGNKWKITNFDLPEEKLEVE